MKQIKTTEHAYGMNADLFARNAGKKSLNLESWKKLYNWIIECLGRIFNYYV